MLCAHKVAYALIDQAWMPRVSEIFEKFDPITAGFTSVRLLGDRKGIEQQTKISDKLIVDRSKELMSWLNVCQRTIRRGVSTFVYVNNHYAGFAPAMFAKNRVTRKTSRDCSSGRVLARLESIFRRVCPNLHKVPLLFVAQLVAQQAEGSAL